VLPATLEAHRVDRKVSDKFTKATPSPLMEAHRVDRKVSDKFTKATPSPLILWRIEIRGSVRGVTQKHHERRGGPDARSILIERNDLISVTVSPGEDTQHCDLEREECEDLTNVHLTYLSLLVRCRRHAIPPNPARPEPRRLMLPPYCRTTGTSRTACLWRYADRENNCRLSINRPVNIISEQVPMCPLFG
jgi:hypothetical protein